MSAETKVDLSIIESKVLGLKVGRCNSDRFEAVELYSQIVENRLDICRLKVPAEDEMASFRLNAVGLPTFFSGSIRRYKTQISTPPPGSYNYPDLTFEIYDGTQDDLLRVMIAGTWGNYPIGYYRTPYLNSLLDKEKEVEALFQFYKSANLNKNNPANSILFMRHGESYVGFFALNILNNNLESHIGGILKPYRKGGYFLDKLRYIKEFCVRNNLEHFIFGARNENSEVQRIFQFVGFQPIGTENVFHIASLLSHTKHKTVDADIAVDTKDFSECNQKLFEGALNVARNIQTDFKRMSFQMNGLESLKGAKLLKISYSFPVITPEEILVVVRSLSTDTNATGYFYAAQ